jgi:hypothetical protein
MTKLLVVVCCVGLYLMGCSSPTTRFYVLSALPAQATATVNQDIAVGVGPVVLPDYLDRPQIVTRNGQNELNLAEFDHWGASLKDNITDVIAENLAVLLPSQKVSVYPWKRASSVKYQVSIKIIRFNRIDNGDVVLQTRWTVLTNDGTELYAQESHYAEKPSGRGYINTVAAMEQALTVFSRDVANSLNRLKGNTDLR